MNSAKFQIGDTLEIVSTICNNLHAGLDPMLHCLTPGEVVVIAPCPTVSGFVTLVLSDGKTFGSYAPLDCWTNNSIERFRKL